MALVGLTFSPQVSQSACVKEPWSCPQFATGRSRPRIASKTLVEASGLVASFKNPGVLFSHNDSGGSPLIFALSLAGEDLGEYRLRGATLIDWEDIAVGPSTRDGEWYLYVADAGNNGIKRDVISIYRAREPEVALNQVPLAREIEDVTRFDFFYPKHAKPDCEAFFIDPWSGDGYFITKPRRGAPSVFRAQAPFTSGSPTELEPVTQLTHIDDNLIFPALVTAADISRDGRQILVRTYLHAYLYHRDEKESIETALSRAPCEVPIAVETQGESIAFLPDAMSFVTTSEGRHSRLHFFERVTSTSPATATTGSPTATLFGLR